MAFPLNNAASAVVISSLPFSIADTFGGVAFGETWFVYTADADDVLLGVHLASSANNPDVIITKTIAQLATVPGFCDKDQPIQTPVTAGVDYYFKIEGEATGAATITLDIEAQPDGAFADGQIWVPDPSHKAVFPIVVVDFASGVTRAIDLVGSDQIDKLPDGTICLAEIPVGVVSTCTQFRLYATDPVTSPPSAIGIVANPISPALMYVKQDHVDAFYVAKAVFSGSNLKVYKINSDATLDPTNWTLPGGTLAAFAVSVGGLIAYTSDFSRNTAIGAYDLVNDVALPDFAAGVTGYQINSLTVLADDSVVATYMKTSDNTIRVIRYDAAGVAQATFNAPGTDTFVGNVAPYVDDPVSIVLRTEQNLESSTFWLLLASDLSVLDSVTLDNFDDGEGHNNTSQFHGPSEAASFIAMPLAAPTTATLTVVKDAGGDTTTPFSFTTTGVGTPGSFDLVGGDSLVISGLAPGTYGVDEIVPSGWTLVSASSSNADPIDAIVLGAGDSVTVTFTNAADAGTGTIIVVKVVDEGGVCTTAFPMVASGLSPASFTLTADESQMFDDVPVGSGYGISETTPTGWRSSIVVSNGSPADDITVADGETVTVTITNTPVPPQLRCWAPHDIDALKVPMKDTP